MGDVDDALSALTRAELMVIAEARDLRGRSRMTREELLAAIRLDQWWCPGWWSGAAVTGHALAPERPSRGARSSARSAARSPEAEAGT